VLIILTYLLVIFGTFITRSGILSSVHSFAQSNIGPILLVFLSIMILITIVIISSRWESLKGSLSLQSYFSKESLIIISVVLFLGLLVTAFWGVLFPILSELVTGQKVTVGPPFYERVFAPVSSGLLIIMVICPLAVWSYVSFKHLGKLLWKPFLISILGIVLPLWGGLTRWEAILAFWLVAFVLAVNGIELLRRLQIRRKDETEPFWTAFTRVIQRNQRSLSSMIIHIAVVLMVLGIIGIEFFQSETQGTIAAGGELQLERYSMVYRKLDTYQTTDARYVAQADIAVKKDGKVVGEVYPRRDYYYLSEVSVTVPGVRSTLVDDFYVILVDWKEVSAEGATFKVYHNPLVKWLWIGSGIFILGVAASTWPIRKTSPARK
jgi:cytochrome c-type biogenesis protein CcmF